MRTTVIICMLIGSFQGEAQLLGVSEEEVSDESYFISFDSDTIYGDVQYANSLFSNRMRKIYFIDADEYRYTLHAKLSNGFMMNGKFYMSKMVDEMYYFLRPAVTGSPALYVQEKNYEKRERNSLAMMRADDKESKVIDHYIERGGKLHRLYPRRFKKQAPRLFEAYPEVVEMIQAEEFTFSDIEEIVFFCNYSKDGVSQE